MKYHIKLPHTLNFVNKDGSTDLKWVKQRDTSIAQKIFKMKPIDNLEELDVGDYVKIYLKEQFVDRTYHQIAKLEKIKKNELLFKAIISDNGTERFYWNTKISDMIVKKTFKKPKKKKLKDKKYSYNNRFIIFKLNKKEVAPIIKEVILKHL